ncbi:ABC transporter substrate-binding protein [Streptomyces roseolus]|uniref:ABC transporter substrate-binding protein n=1 Tax=Streptomyces roseolus TaxID=67358 RepID=UPI00167429B9|nr:ABC transporter substrate-binding protein [Streptomyces roseolus]GGR57898.1 hypothetical protein GCM10010282_58700 [Streptomyces roseolus]
MSGKRITRVGAPLVALLLPLTAGCGGPAGADDEAGGTVTVAVGYQSKTINTVTAGTLLRSLGYFEEELAAQGRRDGVRYRVQWQDYATGAPITARMTAGKIDIGSMGDFPLLLNAARGRQLKEPTRLVSVTGYNLRGGLNTVVTAPGSGLRTLADLKGKRVSTSVGSAADGTLVRALRRAGLDPAKDVTKLNQQPSVGASALVGGSADALSQFVAWPGLLAFQGKAEALYDGAELDLPTFHGITVREEFARERAGALDAFLRAKRRATDRLRSAPVASAESVAKETGLPAEVVYLYNGAQGIATFDPALRPELLAALREDVPVLREAGLVKDVDVDAFVDPAPLRRAVTAPGLPEAGAAKAELRAAPPERAVPALAGGLADRNADVRKAAVLALLAHVPAPEARAALATAAADPDADVRTYAARGLVPATP